MASALIALYPFNDNDTTLVSDFSGNQRNSTVETGLTISTASGAVGKVGVFDGSTTELNFGNITAFNSVTGFSAVFKVYLTSHWGGGPAVFARKQNVFEIQFSTTYNLIFHFYDSTSTLHTLTATTPLTLNAWYTIVVTWDGANIKYYNGSATPSDTVAAVNASFDTSAWELYLMRSARLGCKIEMISFYSKALDYDEIEAVMENPSGVRYEAADGMVQTGDVAYNNSGGSEVCVWYEEFDEALFPDDEEMLFSDGELTIFKN